MTDQKRTARRIEDYALIGSTHSAALVHHGGCMEWLCLPRFDSEAIFASLLGTTEHGGWSLAATDPDARVTRRYLPGTMVLETTIEVSTGKAIVHDFMPHPSHDHHHEVVRIVRGVEGCVRMRSEIRLRFNYGERIPWLQRKRGAHVAVAGPDAVRISGSIDFENKDFATVAEFEAESGQSSSMMLEWYPSHLDPPLPRDAYALFHATQGAWEDWIARYTADGPYAELVKRSLLTLKTMTYRPTGGIVAAPTTSLPEAPGGSRNWDYRYCWIRDAVLTIYSLVASGFMEEASDWRWWLMRAVAGAPDELQIMYGIAGERRLTETQLDHLPGYEDSRPVRIGNAAHEQLQLDVYGSVLAAFDGARRSGIPDMDVVWPLQCAVANHLLTLWREPDSGIWEVRSEPRHFVHSKVMCWLAFDRMVASAEDYGLSGNVDAWREARDTIHAEVCSKGFDEASNSFVQSYGANNVDAALLTLPLLGFLPADDPRIQGTIARVAKDLVRDGVVYRYIPSEGDGDGLAGDEGAFLACSFWLVSAYAMSGRRDDAVALFEHVTGFANDLGLLAEEYDPVSCRQLGNFPQAFSHLALINAAHMLDGTSGTVSDILTGNDASTRLPSG